MRTAADGSAEGGLAFVCRVGLPRPLGALDGVAVGAAQQTSPTASA
jgi:hypothetical protein